MDLGGAFHRGRGGPRGWIILDELELHLGGDILVPDLAGWLRSRLPAMGVKHRLEPVGESLYVGERRLLESFRCGARGLTCARRRRRRRRRSGLKARRVHAQLSELRGALGGT